MSSAKHTIMVHVVIINRDSEVMLVRYPDRGWDLPGGVVEENESISLTVMHNIKNQLGLDVKLTQYCGVFQHIRDGICHIFFLGKQIRGKIAAYDGENLDAGYFPLETAMRLVTWTNFKKRILYCLDESKHPFFVEF